LWRDVCPTRHVNKYHKNNAARYRIPPVNCDLTYKYKDDLEKAVLREVKRVALDPDAVVASQDDGQPTIDKQAIKAQLAKIKRQQAKLVDLYLMNDDLNVDQLHDRAEKLKAQADTLQAQLIHDHDTEKADAFIKAATNATQIDQLDYEHQTAIVRRLIDHINVSNTDLDIYWQI
uniref:hypothetical protein n=1 Tax=Limosilactobacillus fermentum TaxID=1613 RepID=UPI00165126E8